MANGKPVEFVANPQMAPPDPSRVYARPDDLSYDGVSWRQVLLTYNKEARVEIVSACILPTSSTKTKSTVAW